MNPDLPDDRRNLPDDRPDSPGVLPVELSRKINSWRDQDPDPDTVTELNRLVGAAEHDVDAEHELTDAFAGRLAFGTAGLRGQMGPGPNRMNRVTVGQAAAGLAHYLHDQQRAGGRVIIGFDARHKSATFARDSAEILAAAGFEVMITDVPTPTPVVAFGIRHFDCVAGVVVTASHNPAQDNGYKVYLGDGSQIVPPADAEIAEQIDAVAGRPLQQVARSQAYRRIGDELIGAYLDRAATVAGTGARPRADASDGGRARAGSGARADADGRDAARELTWVYTPMHGVGGRIVTELVRRTGFAAPIVVAAQADPDPDFPTIGFPNPEEAGALDLAIDLAEEVGAELVLANDPDADRCAVAVPVETASGPEWRMLRGDELGVLLADDALRRGVSGTYACSIVSSSLLQAMAADHDQLFRYTLTGFKWIGRVPDLAFGYEEAIGYCCDPTAVPDKDGITALLRVLAITAELRADGRTLSDRLDDISARYGVHATDQLSIRVDDLTFITEAMSRLRMNPPTELAGQPVDVQDLAAGVDLGPAGRLPPTDAVLIIGAAIKVVVRPSGTEPKLKCYLQARVSTDVRTVAAAQALAETVLATVRSEMSAILGLA